MNYDKALEMIRSRRSIRSFTDQVPSRQDIEQIIETARWAPSNHNRQGWKFIVFHDQVALQALAGRVEALLTKRLENSRRIPQAHAAELIRHATLFARAPIAILAMHKRPVNIAGELLASTTSGALLSGEALSTAMAVQNMLLAADSLKLGTCVLTAPLLAEEVWREIDELPMGFEPTCVVAVGYPAKQAEAPRKKPLEQIIDYR